MIREEIENVKSTDDTTVAQNENLDPNLKSSSSSSLHDSKSKKIDEDQIQQNNTDTEKPFSQSEKHPILQKSDERFCVFPIKYPSLWQMYKKAVACFWVAEEIEFRNEKNEFQTKLNENEKHFIKHVLAFFAHSDGIVNENLVENFCKEVQCAEARCFYTFQAAMESVHGETYSLLIDTYIENAEEKKLLFRALDNFPTIRQKADWAMKWIGAKNASFAQRVAAFAMVEGIFFSGSFASLYWIRLKGILKGLTFSNELIARDEGLHTMFATMLFNEICPNPNESEKNIIKDMAREALEIEKNFFGGALPVSLIGMNSKSMCDYIEFITDRLLYDLIHEKIFYTKNPFDFMENISLEGKTNFFERKVSEYQKMNVINKGNSDFKTDVNF